MMEQATPMDAALLARAQQQLEAVQDPELPVSIVGLGLVRGLRINAGVAHVQLTFTSMGCPWMEWIQDNVRARLLEVDGIEAVEIEVVWGPAWTRADLRSDARAALKRLGIAP